MNTALIYYVDVVFYAFTEQPMYDFYIGALRNYNGETTDVLLYIMTASTSPVSYTVQTYSETIETGTVTNTTLAKLTIPSNLVVLDSSYQHRYKGIHVSASDEIFVLLINYQSGSVGEYLAYPVQNLNIAQFQYYVVSTGAQAVVRIQPQSEVLLVGIENDTTVTVVPTQNVTLPQNVQITESTKITVAAGTPFSFTLHELQTILLGSSNDLTGTSIVSNKPLTVISGHECGNVPDNIKYCEHLTEQIPPTVNWGQQFLLTPYSDRPVQYYKVIAAEDETTYNLTCGRDNTTTYYLQTSGSYYTHSTGTYIYCSISSDKPILVTQLGPGHMISITGDPVISLVPSVDQYSHEVVFVSPDIHNNEFTSHYVNIATTTNETTILLNGDELSLTWNAIYDYTNNIIGYGTQFNSTSTDTPHVVASYNRFSTLVYGFGPRSAYSYSVGVNGIQGTCINNTITIMCIISICDLMPV